MPDRRSTFHPVKPAAHPHSPASPDHRDPRPLLSKSKRRRDAQSQQTKSNTQIFISHERQSSRPIYCTSKATASATLMLSDIRLNSLCTTCSFLPTSLKSIALPSIAVFTSASFHSPPCSISCSVLKLLPAWTVPSRPYPRLTSAGIFPSIR